MGLKEVIECCRLELALNLLNDCRGNILDVGCGTGSIERRLARRNIVGLDISVENIHESRKRSPYAGYIAADMRRIPIRNEYADNVAMIAVLGAMFQGEETVVFKEARRLMKNGGNLVMLFSQKHPLYSIIATERIFSRWKWRHFKPVEVRKQLQGNWFMVSSMVFIGGPISLIVDLSISFWVNLGKGLGRVGLRKPNVPKLIRSLLAKFLTVEFHHHFKRPGLLARHVYIFARKDETASQRMEL